MVNYDIDHSESITRERRKDRKNRIFEVVSNDRFLDVYV